MKKEFMEAPARGGWIDLAEIVLRRGGEAGR